MAGRELMQPWRLGSWRALAWRIGAWCTGGGSRESASFSGTVQIRPVFSATVTVRGMFTGRAIVAPRFSGTVIVESLTGDLMSIHAGATISITLKGLRNDDTGAYVTSASVVVAILDAEGNPVEGAESIALSHVADTSGASTKYRGVVPSEISTGLAAGTFSARVVSTDDDGVGVFPEPFVVV